MGPNFDGHLDGAVSVKVYAAMNLSDNYFQLFQLPHSFQLDLAELKGRYRRLQLELHPDKHASSDSRQQRLSVQLTAQLNQAFDTLKSPLKRAEYMLGLSGHEVDFNSTTHQDGAFLMQQMELREELESLKSQVSRGDDVAEASLAALQREGDSLAKNLYQQFEVHHSANEYDAAEKFVARAYFVEKFKVELRQVEDELLDLD